MSVPEPFPILNYCFWSESSKIEHAILGWTKALHHILCGFVIDGVLHVIYHTEFSIPFLIPYIFYLPF